MAVRLPTLHASRPLPPRRFLELICVKRLHRPQCHSAAGRIRSVEKASGIGSRTHDLPACSIVPQPTMLLCDPNKKIDFREVGLSGVDWMNLAWDRDQWRAVVNTVMNYCVPCNVGKFFSSWVNGNFSGRTQLLGVSLLVHTKVHQEKLYHVMLCSLDCSRQWDML
jgi:hypothetical protein